MYSEDAKFIVRKTPCFVLNKKIIIRQYWVSISQHGTLDTILFFFNHLADLDILEIGLLSRKPSIWVIAVAWEFLCHVSESKYLGYAIFV